jgi:hypothetical protein
MAGVVDAAAEEGANEAEVISAKRSKPQLPKVQTRKKTKETKKQRKEAEQQEKQSPNYNCRRRVW